MNERLVEVIIRAKDMTASAVNKFRAGMRQITNVVKDVTKAMAAFVAGGVAMVFTLTKIGQQGAKVVDVKAAFARITGDETKALEALRQATGHTISDLELMTEHNQALALGTAKSTEEFARMLRISKELGDALGIDGPEAMDRFANVLASGSQRAARELGLEIRAGMTRNEILALAERTIARVSGAQNDASEAADRFATAVANAKDRLAEFVAESPVVAEFLDKIAGITTSVVNIITGDRNRWSEAFSALGHLVGNAFAAAFFGSIAGVFNSLDRLVLPKWLEDKIATPLGIFGGAAQFNADASLEAALAWADVLKSIGNQPPPPPRAPVGGGGGSTVPTPLEELLGLDVGRRVFTGQDVGFTGAGGPPTPGHREWWRTPTAARGGGITVPRLAPRQAPIPKAAKDFEDASQVAVAAFGAMGEAALRGSKLTADSIIGMIANIAQSLPGVGGLAGSLIGAAGGLFGALFSRKKDPVRVAVAEYEPAALAQMEQHSGPKQITTVIEQGGVEIERIERELLDRQNRDEVVRYSRGRKLTS